MTKILKLIFKATDKVSPTLDKIEGQEGRPGGVAGLASSLKGLINPATLAAGAVGALGTAAVATFSNYQQYVSDVADLNAMIGGTLEETSMLTRFMKDFDISADAMSGTMMALARNGFDPSIKGLIALRDRLDEAGSETERLTIAAKLGGEQFVTKFMPAIEAAGDELDNYAESFDEGLIVTEEMVEQQIKMEKAVARSEAAWDKLQLTLGAKVSPAIVNVSTDIADMLEGNLRPFEDFVTAWERWGRLFSGEFTWEAFMKGVPQKLEDAYAAMGEYDRATRSGVEAVEGLMEATKDLSEKQYWQAAAEALYAGQTLLAQKYVDEATKAGNYADAIQSIIDSLKELDGTSVSYNIIEGHQWTGGPSWLDQQLPGPSLPPTVGGIPEGGFPTWAAAIAAGYKFVNGRWVPDFQTGGSFQIGGGRDSQLVSFRGDPGEHVNISKEDSIEMLVVELRRIINILPITVRDAVERVL